MNAIYIVTDCDLVGSIVHEIYMTEPGEDWPVQIVSTDEVELLRPANGSVLVVAKEHNHYIRTVCHRHPTADFSVVNFDRFDLDDVHEKVTRLLSQTSSKNFAWRAKKPAFYLNAA